MNKNNINYQITYAILPEINKFASFMEEVIIPTFDDYISQKADKVEKEAYENPSRYIDPEDYDPSDAADDAFHKGLEFYLSMQSMRQGVLNLFAVGLHHLFEQQFLALYRTELLKPDEKNLNNEDLNKLLTHKKAKKRLCEYGIEVEDFPSWAKVNELRLVANVVKHADGRSAEDLKLNPDFVKKHPSFGFTAESVANPTTGYTPLIDDGIAITLDEFKEYVGSVKQFWREMRKAVLENSRNNTERCA